MSEGMRYDSVWIEIIDGSIMDSYRVEYDGERYNSVRT
jgi:hypothetical protein